MLKKFQTRYPFEFAEEGTKPAAGMLSRTI